MHDARKTKSQLIDELENLRRRVAALETPQTEAGRAGSTPHESEDRFRPLFEGSLDPIFLFDPESGEILDANPAASEVLSRPLRDIVGMHFIHLVPSRMEASTRQLFKRQVAESDHGRPVETTLVTANGKEIATELLAQIIQVTGVPVLLATFRDITDRKRTEETLRNSEERFRLLIQNASDITVMFDEDGTIRYVSPPLERILGYRPEELVGKAGTDLLHPEDRATMLTDLAKSLTSDDEPVTAQYRFRHKDGSWRTLESVANNCLEHPAIRAVIVNSRDVTERNELEEQLQKSEERYRLIAQNSPDIITIINPDDSFRYISPAAERILGYTPEEVIEHMGFDHVHPEDRPAAYGAYTRLLENPGELLNVRYRLRRKDGSWRYVEALGNNVLANPALRAIILNIRDITHQKELEDALRSSEERHRLLVQNSTDIISILNADGTLRYVSPSVEWTLGFTPEEAIEEATFNNIHPEDRRATRAILTECMKKPGSFATAQYRLLHKNGSWRDVEAVANNQLDNPTLHAVIVNLRDITDRKELEDALRSSEERHRLLVQNSSDIIGIMAEDGTPLYVSPSIEKVLGYSWQEAVRRFPLEEVHPEDQQNVRDALSHCLKNPDELTTVHFRLRHQDGSWRYIESVANNQLANPVLKGVVLNSRDITERKEAERTLARSEYKYRFLHENLRDASATVNLEGTIVEFNAAFQEMLGYDSEEIPRLTYRDITPQKWHAMEEKILWEQIMKRGYSDIYEKEYIRKDGTIIPVELRSHIVLDEDGREIGRWAIVRNISERKRLEEELLKAAKLESLGVLCGGIAHDFNNILTAVMTNLSMAQMYGELGEDIEKMLADAEKASLRAKGLTQQLLTFAKGGEPIKKTVILSKLIKDTVDFALSGSNVKCEHDFTANLRPIEADEGQIGQVIQNVILNADQAMPEGGVIRVQAENVSIPEADPLPLGPGPHVRISILDQGIGIPAEHLQKVFDPFFTTKQKGSGLGLSTSFSIVKRHDGALRVESRLGGGTEVLVYLPALAEGYPAEGKKKSEFFKGTGRVLLVDDDDALRRSIATALNRLGYEVQTAEEGAEGIRIYQEARSSGRPVDVVVMDLTIPGGMGGQEAAQELLRVDPEAKLIASSGYSTDPVMSDFRAYGFRAVISKPYRLEDLGETLRRVLEGG